MEDNAIIELYWQRSQNAISETAAKYGGRLNSLSMNILHSREDAEECVNDTYHAAWNTLPPQRPGFFFAYLAKLTRNFSFSRYDYYHAKKRGATVVELSSELEQKMESKEIGRIVSEFLHSQSPEMRRVFVRRYWYLDSIQTISEAYGISESKVKSMLFRMRGKLREHFEKEGVEL